LVKHIHPMGHAMDPNQIGGLLVSHLCCNFNVKGEGGYLIKPKAN